MKTVSSRLVDKTNDTYTIHSTTFRACVLCGVKSLEAHSLGKHCRHGNIIIYYIARLWCSEYNRADVVIVMTKFNWPNDRIDFATEVFLPPGVIPLSIAHSARVLRHLLGFTPRQCGTHYIYIYICASTLRVILSYESHYVNSVTELMEKNAFRTASTKINNVQRIVYYNITTCQV